MSRFLFCDAFMIVCLAKAAAFTSKVAASKLTIGLSLPVYKQIK